MHAESRTCGGERGAIAVLVALALVPMVIAGAALGVDLSMVRWASVQSQNAADAAALAGVVHLPADPDRARQSALAVAAAHGFGADDTSVTVETEAAARLRVTTNTRLAGVFADVIWAAPVTVNRTAVAEYAAPLLLGSPCNVFGREDMPANGGGVDQQPVASDDCADTGNYWAGVMGSGMDKSAGDAFGSLWCTWPRGSQATDDCAPIGEGPNPPGRNLEYRSGGYTYVVRVRQPGVLRLQAYDLGWVSTGPLCQGVLSTEGLVNPLVGAEQVLRNEFVSVDSALNYRYFGAMSPYCTGDTQELFPFSDNSPDALAMATHASFKAPRIAGGAQLCPTVTLQGIQAIGTSLAELLQPGEGDDLGWQLRRTFHRWIDVCPAVEVSPGDYELTVAPGPGSGANRFALRAWLEGESGGVSVAAKESMHVYSNFVRGSSLWHLVRLDSTAAGRTVEISVFDLGDAEQPLVVELLAPSSDDVIGPCSVRGAINGAIERCRITAQRSVTNGRWVHFEIPIPSSYRCDADRDMAQCWVRARITTDAAMFDATTWTARVLGEPVRLVQ